MANGTYDTLVIRTTDILGDVEELVIPQTTWQEIDLVDSQCPGMPMWFDSERSWDFEDFSNPEIYTKVEFIWR